MDRVIVKINGAVALDYPADQWLLAVNDLDSMKHRMDSEKAKKRIDYAIFMIQRGFAEVSIDF